MVTSIKKPTRDPLVTLQTVLDTRVKYVDFYTSITPALFSQFNLYISSNGSPSAITVLDLNHYTASAIEANKRKKTLINLYSPDEDSELFKILFDMRRNHDLLYCPSCGQTVVPNTLDHYLPKDCFPELSIMLLNLVPMCFDCQGEKGTDYLTLTGNKKFIHPYFDVIDIPLLEVKFNSPYSTPTFELLINNNLSPEMSSLVKSHIQGIGLEKRYSSYCKARFIPLLRLAKRARLSPQGNSLISTLKEILINEEDKSYNCWEAIFYRSVLKDHNLLAFLISDDLPEII